jgi:DNA-binding response OmpR family regulator
VQNVLRRTLAEFAPETPFDLGEFRLDPNRRSVWQRGTALSLATREYELLAFLLKHPNQVFTREQLLHAVWHWDFGDRSTVTVHVRRLREKIERDVARPAILTTVWGVGYQLIA